MKFLTQALGSSDLHPHAREKGTLLPYVYRNLSELRAAQPAPGEIWLCPPKQEPAHRLALQVLECKGVGLPCGGAPVECLVLPDHPTLDQMLAASFVERLLKNEPLPDTLQIFASYADLWDDGLIPGSVPLEKSLGGVYLALITDPQEDLTQPDAAERFTQAWRRLEAHIFRAAEAGQDPFTDDDLFSQNGEFERQLAFLKGDEAVYRQDVARGEKWRARLPDGDSPMANPNAIASALLLRKPRSRFFKNWCRADQNSPTGDGYRLLVVQRSPREWIVSTDPCEKVSLKPLAELLQAAERYLNRERAEKDPWFDGTRFNHALISSPREGSILTEKEVLKIVWRWTGAPHNAPVLGCAALLLGSLALLLTTNMFFGVMPAPPERTARIGVRKIDDVSARHFVTWRPSNQESESESPAFSDEGRKLVRAAGDDRLVIEVLPFSQRPGPPIPNGFAIDRSGEIVAVAIARQLDAWGFFVGIHFEDAPKELVKEFAEQALLLEYFPHIAFISGTVQFSVAHRRARQGYESTASLVVDMAIRLRHEGEPQPIYERRFESSHTVHSDKLAEREKAGKSAALAVLQTFIEQFASDPTWAAGIQKALSEDGPATFASPLERRDTPKATP